MSSEERDLAKVGSSARKKVALAIVVLAVLVFLPAFTAGGLGRFVGGLWVSTLGLITQLLGGFFAG